MGGYGAKTPRFSGPMLDRACVRLIEARSPKVALGATDEEMAMIIAQKLTSVLGESPEGRRLLLTLIQNVSDGSGSLRSESPTSPGNGSLASLMLRIDLGGKVDGFLPEFVLGH